MSVLRVTVGPIKLGALGLRVLLDFPAPGISSQLPQAENCPVFVQFAPM